MGSTKPNCTRRDHVLQVITGPGKLADRVNDFIALAGLECHGNRGNGVFLVQLTTKQADLDATVARIAQHEAMKQEQQQKWEEAKEEVRAQKREFKNQMKADKTQLREAEAGDKAAAKAAEKAKKLAERAEAKELKQADRAQFQIAKRAIKDGMKERGFANWQIKVAGKALNYSSIE